MDVLFGDATTAMPTPATQGERGSLMSAGSPIPSLDIRRQYGQHGAESAIPGLNINPPNITSDNNGKGPQTAPQGESRGRSEGLGGWISNIVSRNRGPSRRAQDYRRLEDQDAEIEH